MQDRIGEHIGKYRILRLLGRGGTGTVYLATDSELDREVALKELHPELSQSSVHVAHFRSEAKVLAGIHHPHIVPVHAFLQEESTLYIDMAYIEGRSLRQLLSEEVLSFDTAVRLIRQVLEALVACHAVTIIHCDLKPSNILIDARGNAHLVDFGWAASVSALDVSSGGAPSLRETHFVGTPAYASPESWTSDTPTARWDLFALGVIAGEMLLGFPPAAGERLKALLQSNSRIPEDYGDWIERMMAHDTSVRFATSADALHALESIVDARDEVERRSLSEETIVRRRPKPRPTGWTVRSLSSGKTVLIFAILCGLIWVALKSGGGQGGLQEDTPAEPVTAWAPISPNSEPELADNLPHSGEPDHMLVVNESIFFSALDEWSDRALYAYNLESRDLKRLIPASEVRDKDIFLRPFPDGSGQALALSRGEGATPRLWVMSDKGDVTALKVDGLEPQSDVNLVDFRNEILVAIRIASTNEYFFHQTDGSTANTRLIWRTIPGVRSGPGIQYFVPTVDDVRIGTNSAGGGLWRFTGDEEDSYPLISGSIGPTTQIVAWKGLAWATVETPNYGRELWRTDGTEDGTRLFIDLRPGPQGAFQFDRDPGLRIVRDWLIFAARTDENGLELWRTDGTKEGTSLIRDIAPGATDSDPYQWTPFQGRLYFTALTRETGRELWVTDGTREGTRMIADIKPGYESSEPYSLCASEAGLFFTADDEIHGEELWLLRDSDGVPELVADLYPGEKGAEPYKTQAVVGGVAFAATSPEVGRELFFSDGTPEGTHVLLDLARAPGDPLDGSTIGHNGAQLCTIESPELGVELGMRVGQDDTPRLLLDIVPGPEGSDPADFFTVGDMAYFSANDKLSGREIWVTDFTPTGTHVAADVNFRERSSNPRDIMYIDGTVYFVAECDERGTELWRLDAPNRRATALESVPRSGSSNPQSFQRRGNMLIYEADDITGKRGTWKIGAGMDHPVPLDEAPKEGEASS